MEKEKLLEVRNIIEDIKNNGISEEYIKELYKYLGYDMIPLHFTNLRGNVAAFSPKYNSIAVNIDKSVDWTTALLNDSLEHFDIKDKELLKAYSYVSLLSHEIEHSHQKLIADKKIDPKYSYQSDAYHTIFEIMRKKDYYFPRPISLVIDIFRFIIYMGNAYSFILERNATIEGYNISSQIASLTNEKDIMNAMITYRNSFILQGYTQSGEGTLKHTFDSLGLMKKYNKLILPSDISLAEKAREGLEITEEERNKLELILKESSTFKK